MVHKIRFIIFIIIFTILCVVGFMHKGSVETNLLKTLLPKQITNSGDMISIANKSSSIIKVVFESDNQLDLEELKQNFNKQIDTIYFETNKPDVSKILEKYLSQPMNFLSEPTRKLLKDKKYDEVYEKSIESLYSPTGINLNTLDKDPYLLLDDFIMSNIKMQNSINYLDGKYYDFVSLKIKNDQALSPTLSNKKVQQLINVQKQLSDSHSKIYLAGTPIHSYYTSTRSMADINIICILSILMIIFLTYRYFKNLKILLPIALSIAFGMLCGYVATKIWFESFQVITMVFSTTLIGIGIDYSYHYFFINTLNKKFIKNLSFSLLTTIVPFTLLYLTGIELLQQVSVFTIFGLIGIYTVVLFIYPCFKYSAPIKTYNPNHNLYKMFLIILFTLSIVGIVRFHFNDNLTALYSPSKYLLNAEKLYSKISAEDVNPQVIVVKGDNINKIIEIEEEISNELKSEYLALSKFFPSELRQKENFQLVKDLYNNNLNKYSDILTTSQIENLRNTKFIPVKFDNLYLKDFMLDSNTSLIIVGDNHNINITNKNAYVINFQSDIIHYMKHYRYLLLTLFPVVILVLYILLTCLYDYKKAFKILLPSIVGAVSAILLTGLIYGELNLFSIITIYLVIGFTIDYSIFRIDAEEKTESAVFVSCLTTAFSFLLLALCGFKMLSSMALVLFFGIVTSYITGYLLLQNKNNAMAKWFQIPEQSAGVNRLRLSWFLYKLFGKNVLYLIALIMAIFTFLSASKVREYSRKYFKVIQTQTGLKPNLINQFKLIHSYANSLVDKLLVYSGDFDSQDIVFENSDIKNQLFEDIKKKNGVFFICNHIGNIEVLQSLFLKNETKPNFNINIFMSGKQSQIFNSFLQTIKREYPIKTFRVEDIGLNTGIELKDNLNNGDVVFIAGDRVAQNNDTKNIEVELFAHKIYLPKGTFKLAKLMDVPTYFISAIKTGKNYKILLEKQFNLTEKSLTNSYVKFLEHSISVNPFQFFHFFDFFN